MLMQIKARSNDQSLAHMDMQRLDVGKTSEDCGQHLGIIADPKTDMEVQDRDS
jgi:hypothetical protein